MRPPRLRIARSWLLDTSCAARIVDPHARADPVVARWDFVERSARAVAEIRAAMATVRSRPDTPSGLLRLNASVQGARQIARAVLEFLRRHPEMQVDLVTEGRLVDIVNEGLKLGIRPADLVPPEMIALPLGQTQRYAVVASPAWLAARSVPLTPADLPVGECIRVRLPSGALFCRQFEKDGCAVQIDAKSHLTLDEAAIPRAAVLDGVGIGFFIERDVAGDIAAGRMVRLPDDWAPPRPGFSLC